MLIHGIYGAGLLIPDDQDLEGKKANIIIFPGGGYEHISEREGMPVLRALNKKGFRGMVLNYDVETRILGLRPLKQAMWAVLKVRRLFEGPVFLLGFSAGGHLALSLGIHHDDTDWNGMDIAGDVFDFLEKEESESNEERSDTERSDTDRFNKDRPYKDLRPDGMILSYPVVTTGEYAHRGSIERLLGTREDFLEKYSDDSEYEQALRWFSLEKQVHESTCPAFIWQTGGDKAVPVMNSILLTKALHSKGIPVEYHLYPFGVHGLSLGTEEVMQPEKGRLPDPHIADWINRCADWICYMEKYLYKS